MRGVVTLGILAGTGWYLYRKLTGGGTRSGMGAGLVERLPQPVRQAVNTAASRVQAATAGSQRTPDGEQSDSGSPAEARAAAMAGMPAVQPPATIPEG